MTASRTAMLCGAAIALVALTGTASSSAQSGLALARLTVPDANLPENCKLMPYIAPTTQAVQVGAFPGNPWSGTDPKLLATVRGRINAGGGSKPLPDVPLPRSGQPAVASTPRADDVLEAYHAAYVWIEGYQVDVFAATFKDMKLAADPESLSAMLNPPRGFSHRLVRGATAIRVSASSENACVKAVVAHVESLK